MHNLLRTLLVSTFFIFTSPSYADSACGSDTSTDPIVALGKDVWLNGYCKSFIPCRLVLEQFHACQAAESFLNNLGAEKGVSLTSEQVEAALVKTNQGSGAGASSDKKPMSRNVAIIEFNRVTEMDSKAEALVQSNCGAFACDRLLESSVNPVIREVEVLNSNPEYLAHMPKFAPIASVETAARFGWKKDGAFWEQSGVNSASRSNVNTSTLKDYLLSLPECQKLHDKLSQEIKANPSKEPFNLSFFEGECVAQLASYAEEVKSWRALMAAKIAKSKPAAESGDSTLIAGQSLQVDGSTIVAPEVPDADLREWNDGLVAAEKQREAELLAAAEAKQKAEEEKKRLADEAAIQQANATAEAEQRAVKSGWVIPSDCQAEQTAVRQYQTNGGDVEGPITEALRRPWVYRWGGKDGEQTVAELKQSEQGYLNSIKEHQKRAAQCRATTGLGRIMCPTEDETFQTRLDRLTACAYGVAATRKGGNVSSTAATNQSTGNQSSGDLTCEAKFKSIDNQVAAALPSCGGSATCNLQAAMWGLNQQISAIESYCPRGKFSTKLLDTQKQLESVVTTCNQIISGGRCEPKL